jgi:hypothetical protein
VKSGSGLDNWKMKKLIAVAIVSTLLVFLSLYAVNAVSLVSRRANSLKYPVPFYIIQKTCPKAWRWVSKASRRRDVIKPASIATDKLSLIIFILPISALLKGKIVCTAFWGKLATPVALPAELHKTPRGFLLAQFSRKDFFTGNAAIYNNIIIFTSRYAYDKFTPVTASYSLSATTKDFGRVFFRPPRS